MKTKILFSCITVASLTACGFVGIETIKKISSPDAVGRLETVFVDNTSTNCYGTLIDSTSVLSLNHCVSGKVVSNMNFYPKDSDKSIALIPPSEISYSISSLEDFPKDVAIFNTMKPVTDINPIKISKARINKNEINLRYVNFPFDSEKLIDWTSCFFSLKSYAPGAYISSDCHTLEGTSGRPFLSFVDSEWTVSGIYHGYLKIKNDKGEIVTEGVGTIPSSWNHIKVK